MSGVCAPTAVGAHSSPATRAWPSPCRPGLTDGQAAAVTTAHATAWYGLHELARIRRGDKVLIHSATGGVGQAAIAIARAAGAEIFATAGSEQRRQLLRDMGIEHVYDSRSTRVRRADTPRHRRVRRRHRAELGDRRRPARGPRIAGLRWTIRRDRQARHLRRHPAGALPVPAQPHVLRRRPGVAVVQPSGPAARLVEHGVPAHRGRLAADAGEHALPAGRRRHRHPGDERRPAHRQARARHPAHRAAAAWWCRRHRPGSSAATAPTSSPAGWVAWDCSWPRRWPSGRAAGASCCPRVRSRLPRRWRRSSASARSVPTSWWSAATSPNPAPRSGWWPAATATGLPVRGVLHAAAVVEDATLTNITDELIERDWAPKVYGAWNLHDCHRRAAVGLVLLVLLGGRTGGLARAGRLRRGQQLAGRLHPVAPGAGPAGHRDRVGCLGPDRARHRLRGGRRRCYRSRRRRLRVRSAAAPRPRLHRLRADHGHAVVDRLRPTQPLRRSVPLHRAKPNGHKQIACRAQTSCPWTSGPPGCGV